MSLLTGIYGTDKTVLVHYPRDAGGKFLIACLKNFKQAKKFNFERR